MSKRPAGSLRRDDIGENVEINGWVNRRRDHGGLIFIDLRDRDGIAQVVFDPADGSFAEAEKLRNEDVIRVHGIVRARPIGTENPRLPTGEVEVGARDLHVWNRSEVPPFQVNGEGDVDENLRMEFRYLDLRRPRMQRNLTLRHKLIKAMRDFFDEHEFVEIETPMFVKSTPEGARDYLVPSRLHPGSFYALPQSPQLLKQTLMVAGFGRYMQIARCMRDEDSRADRQTEFTQLDVEMSFCTQEDVMTLMEACMRSCWKSLLGVDTEPFPRYTYDEVMSRFGSDKPDLRFGLELHEVTGLFVESPFVAFRSVVDTKGAIVAVRYPDGAARSRRDFDALTEVAKQHGARGMVWIALNADGYKSSAQKFLDEKTVTDIAASCEAVTGDAVLLFADARATALAVAGRMRNEIGMLCNMRNRATYRFAWVTDFPYLEMDEATGKPAPSHHPFTAPGDGQWAYIDTDPLRMRAQHYDLVLNGFELGSGSIRLHKPEEQRRIFAMLGMSDAQIDDRFGFFMRALEYGAPPHGGMALGIDRVAMLAAGEDNIREVIAFPKNQMGRDLMMDAPSPVPAQLLADLGIEIKPQR